MRSPRIVIGETPFRYSLKTARAAVTAYNRHAGFMTTGLLPQRSTIDQIVNPPTGPLYRGDFDAIVIFAYHGFLYLHDGLDEETVETALGEYIKPEPYGHGGKLSDLYLPMLEALQECGVVKIERITPTNQDGAGAHAERPSMSAG